MDQTNQLCAKLVKDYPDTQNLTVMVQAILLAREGKPKEAAKLLAEFAVKNPTFKLDMSLAAVQLLLSEVSEDFVLFYFFPLRIICLQGSRPICTKKNLQNLKEQTNTVELI